jgi:hypothetical protein
MCLEVQDGVRRVLRVDCGCYRWIPSDKEKNGRGCLRGENHVIFGRE